MSGSSHLFFTPKRSICHQCHEMENNPSPARSSYFSNCIASPSWFPVHRDQPRFHLLGREGPDRSRSWSRLFKRLMKEGKSACCSKPLTFGYDAVSYAKNFDDSCRRNDGSGHQRLDDSWQVRACKSIL